MISDLTILSLLQKYSSINCLEFIISFIIAIFASQRSGKRKFLSILIFSSLNNNLLILENKNTLIEMANLKRLISEEKIMKQKNRFVK